MSVSYYDPSDGLPGRYLCGGRPPPRLARQGAHLVVAAETAAAAAPLPHALPAPCLQDPRLPPAARRLLALLLRQGATATHPLAGHLQGRERLPGTQQPLKRSVQKLISLCSIPYKYFQTEEIAISKIVVDHSKSLKKKSPDIL